MKPNRLKAVLVPLLGLIVVLGLAFSGQALFDAESRYNAQHLVLSFSLVVMPLTALFSTLFSTGALLGLFWYVLQQPARPRLVGVSYLAVGLVGANYYLLAFWMGRVGLVLIPPSLLWEYTIVAPNSVFTIVAGGVAMAGLLMLVLPRRPA